MDLSTFAVIGMLLVVVVIVLALAGKTLSAGKEDAPMSTAGRRILIAYLLLLGLSLAFLLAALGTIDFPETPADVSEGKLNAPAAATSNNSATKEPNTTSTTKKAGGAPPKAPAGTAQPAGGSGQEGSKTSEADKQTPVLLRALPSSTLGSAPTIEITLYGKNLDEPKVRFNGNSKERPVTIIEQGTLIQVNLEARDVVGRGSIAIEVVNKYNKVSNALVIAVNKPTAYVHFFFWCRKPKAADDPEKEANNPEDDGCFRITRELQLLLLVIVAGALGSFLHALRSVLDFIGNRTLVASWFWWYAARPFIGMAMALIFYAVLRGGFLAGTPADAKAVSPFGVVAIGALVGMFSDKAALKLAEIFDTLFKTPESRTDKLAAPTVARLDPEKITVGTTPLPDLVIIGDHLAKVTAVLFDGVERKPKVPVTAKQVTVALTDADVATEREITITIVDADAGKVLAGKLPIVKKDGGGGQNIAAPAAGTGGSGGKAPASAGNAPPATPGAGG